MIRRREALKKFQSWSRACHLVAMLPDDDLDGAREIVREFIAMVEDVGLLEEGQKLELVDPGGNSSSSCAIPIVKSPMLPE